MSAPPYMKLFWGDYHKATRHLNRSQHGAYFLLIGEAWRLGGSLPDDDAMLAAWSLCSPSDWAEIKPVIMAFFALRRGKWVHDRVRDELAAYEATSRKRKEAGKSGGLAKSGKDTGIAKANATQKVTKPKPEPEPESEVESSLRSESSPAQTLNLIAAPDRSSDVQRAFDAYNVIADELSLPKAKALTDDRKKKLGARIKASGLSGWLEALECLRNSPHCRGVNDRGWQADLDFLLQQKSFNRLIEGSYGDRNGTGIGTDRRQAQRLDDLGALHDAGMAAIDQRRR